MNELYIRTMTKDDWRAVSEIYEYGIKTGKATFETEVPSWEKWDHSHLSLCRIVACLGEKIVGWIALSPISARKVYAGVAEISVYVHPLYQGKGIGKLLMKGMIEQSEELNIWTLQAGIFPENKPSIALHTSCGFRIVGKREKIAQLNNLWRDLLLLERRSKRF